MFEQIRANQRKSALLVAIIAALLLILGYAVGETVAPGAGLAGLLGALVIWLIMTLSTYYRGHRIFLGLSRARKIGEDDLPMLTNVVQEMSIAAGLARVPDIYVIDDRAPNAFATGRDPEHAALAVTSGLLRMCNRDELQGVIAHEIGHVKNRDVLLMLMAGVMVGAIAILAHAARRWLWYGGGRRSRRADGDGGQLQVVILVAALLLMILGPLLAQLVYFAISRRREYLADASSAVFTRYPEGLASALEKIADSPEKLASATDATAPMYIVNPLRRAKGLAANMTRTHPPISERVHILRSMAGASFAAYDQGYRQVRSTARSVLPPSVAAAAAPAQPAARPAEPAPKERARRVDDLFWRWKGYQALTCPCGAEIKMPPGLSTTQIACPRCARRHDSAGFRPLTVEPPG